MSDSTPRETLLRLPDVVAATGMSRASIYQHIQRGTFPAPIKITARCSAWPRSEVQAWIEQRIAASRGEAA